MMTETALNEKQWALMCHLGALSGFVVPFGNIIVPAVIWSMKKDQSPLVDQHGKESLNFELSMLIYYVIAFIFCFILIGIPILFGLIIIQVISIIKAAVTADTGKLYRYPITIRFVQ